MLSRRTNRRRGGSGVVFHPPLLVRNVSQILDGLSSPFSGTQQLRPRIQTVVHNSRPRFSMHTKEFSTVGPTLGHQPSPLFVPEEFVILVPCVARRQGAIQCQVGDCEISPRQDPTDEVLDSGNRLRAKLLERGFTDPWGTIQGTGEPSPAAPPTARRPPARRRGCCCPLPQCCPCAGSGIGMSVLASGFDRPRPRG